MRPERMKLPAILGLLVGSGLALLAWSQTWFAVRLAEGQSTAGGAGVIEVGGAVASPALAALALAGLALAGALAIAGPVIRLILGVLALVLGGSVVLAAWLSLADPVSAVSAAVADATGVAGAEPTAELVEAAAATAWPYAALAGGLVIVAAGIVVILTGRAWATSRRYGGGVRMAPEGARDATPASDRAVDDWDGLSRGDDPTDDGRDSTGGGGHEPSGRTR